jgi:predicted amidophosphoribosyltransferase
LASAYLIVQGVIWRLPVTPGVCVTCGYDLTGNVSGTCPECGTRIVEDQSIPAQFYRRKHRWLPELSLFPDARIRYDAWRQANRELHGWWTLWAVVCLAGSVCVLAAGAAGYERAVWAVAGPFVAFATADQWFGRRKMRRALRRQLRSQGLCEKCGRALIGDRCAECGPPTALT